MEQGLRLTFWQETNVIECILFFIAPVFLVLELGPI